MAWYFNLPSIFAQAKPAADVAGDGMSVALNLFIALGVVVGSFVLGSIIARGLRMPDYSTKIGIVLFTLIAGLAVNFFGWPPKRGIDLSGGVVLVYEVDKGLSQPSWMQTAIGRLNDELNVGGGEKLEARPVGADQIEVVVPNGVAESRVDRAVAQLRTADLMLNNTGKRPEGDKTVFIYKVDQQQKTVDMDKLIAAVGRRINPSGVKELTIRQYGAEQLEIIIPEIEEREVDQIKKTISTSGLLEFRIVANENDDKDIIRAALKTPGRDVYIGGKLMGRWVQVGPDLDVRGSTTRETAARGKEILVRIDPFDVDGRYLSRAASGLDGLNHAVNFSFNTAGAEKFGQLTGRNLPDPAIDFHRRLGIILDNVMLSAPNINSTIHGDGQITGNFTQEEVDFLVGVLNAGSLPASLRPEPISQQRVSSQLGDDTIRKGTDSIIISTLAILAFMAIYYRFCGVVADLAVTLNIVITVALMILIKAAFTLPGLAGLVLTVGMAVDANVLIYERMREETERGASLRMAIRNGFGRAMATIIDSHVTTLISAVVLYIVGTDQIKGFAVTLIIGLLMSLFTAVYVSRVIFDIAEKKRWLTKLNMMHLIGHTNIDFIRWRGPAIAGSVIVILIGLVAAAARGPGLLDIDFTGGSSVQVLFVKEKDIADVRLAVADLDDVAVSSVGERGLEFKIDTSEKDIKKVQAELQEKFAGSLQTYSMTFGPLTTIQAAEPATEPAGEASPKEPAKSEETPPSSASPETPKSEPAKTEESPKSAGLAAESIELASTNSDDAISSLLLARVEQDAAQETKADAPAASDPATEKTETAPAAEKPAAAPVAAASPADTNAESSKPAAAAQAVVETGMVGGTRVELSFPQPVSYVVLRDMVKTELDQMKLGDVLFELRNPKYQLGSDALYPEWTLEIMLPRDQTETVLKNMQSQLDKSPVFPSSNQIGGKVAGDTQLMAVYSLLASMAIIVVYVWFRFENVVFGLAAVLALLHDVLVTVAFLALSSYLSPYLGFLLVDPFKISLAVVAALLTIVGFSINDTIVVFDRIREVRGKSPELTPEMINLSVNATMSRTLLTSGTVLIASVILYFVGGPGIHAFAYAMVVGVIAGTYSSIYIAAPVLLWMKKPAAQGKKSGSAIGAAAGVVGKK